jgi:uncharacterized repeat protein (TIGR01451 family)
MGWHVTEQPPDLSITQFVANRMPTPGEPMTLTIAAANNGAGPAAGVRIQSLLPKEILNTTWDTSPSLLGTTEIGGTPYSWKLPDLAVGMTGVITIHGTIDSQWDPSSSLIIEATISSTNTELILDNNTSSVTLGGRRVYLPLVLR